MRRAEITYSNIEAERVRCGLSKEELSQQLEVTPKTYQNWQKKKGDIPASKLLKMAQLFKCSIDYLLQPNQ